MKLHERNKMFVAVIGVLLVVLLLTMIFGKWFVLVVTLATLMLVIGFMVWTIRDSRRRDKLAPDRPIRRGPDPLSGRKSASKARFDAPQVQGRRARP